MVCDDVHCLHPLVDAGADLAPSAPSQNHLGKRRASRILFLFPPIRHLSDLYELFHLQCTNTLRYNLPILAGWLVIAKVGVLFSIRARVKRHAGYPGIVKDLALEENSSKETLSRETTGESP